MYCTVEFADAVCHCSLIRYYISNKYGVSVCLTLLSPASGERRQADAGMGSYLCAKVVRVGKRRTVRVHLVVGGLALAAVHDAELVVERSLLLLELEDLALQLGRRHFARTCLQAADVQVSARQQMVCTCAAERQQAGGALASKSAPFRTRRDQHNILYPLVFFFLCENSRTRCPK